MHSWIVENVFLGEFYIQTHVRLDMHITYPAHHITHRTNHAFELVDSLTFKYAVVWKLLTVHLLHEALAQASFWKVSSVHHNAREGDPPHTRWKPTHDKGGERLCVGIKEMNCNNG